MRIASVQPRTEAVAAVLVVLVGVSATWFITRYALQGIGALEKLALLGLAGGVAALVVSRRPVLGAIALVTFAIFDTSLFPTLISVGGFDVRYVDAATVLVGAALFLRVTTGRGAVISPEFRALFLPLLPFLAYAGISLIIVDLKTPERLPVSAASYSRLIVTASFALMVHLSVRSRRDITIFNTLFMLAASSLVGYTAWKGISELGLAASVFGSGRFGALNNVNTIGLVAAILMLYTFVVMRGGRWPALWLAPLLLGLAGTALTKSAASIGALTVSGALAVGSSSRSRLPEAATMLRWGVIVLGITLLGVFALQYWRGEDIQQLLKLSGGGSFVNRLTITYAGLQVFFDHPIFGVGWLASPLYLGAAFFSAPVLRAFPDIYIDSYYLISAGTLHNLYLQVLVELGVVGLSLLVFALFQAGRAVYGILKMIPSMSLLKRPARFYAFSLVLLAVWWNTNPLFGGQAESILAFSFIGALASVGRIARLENDGLRDVQPLSQAAAREKAMQLG